jgi:hypothetical protein
MSGDRMVTMDYGSMDRGDEHARQTDDLLMDAVQFAVAPHGDTEGMVVTGLVAAVEVATADGRELRVLNIGDVPGWTAVGMLTAAARIIMQATKFDNGMGSD